MESDHLLIGWKEEALSEVTTLIKRGVTPKYTDESGTLVINQKCIRDYKILYEPARYTNSKSKKIPEEKLLKKGDVLVNSTGVGTLGRVAQILEIDGDCTADSHVTIVRPDTAKFDLAYFGYILKSKQKWIEALGEGSTGQTELSRVHLGEIKIKYIEDKNKQQEISLILSSLDDQIELNNSMNKTLEAMAQTLFKEWFEYFNFPDGEGKPYQKSGGLMRSSELGMIPEGWEVKSLDDLVSVFNGYSYKGADLMPSNSAMITIKNFDRNGGYKANGLKELSLSSKVKEHHFAYGGDLIIAHTDLTQGAEIIGNPILIPSKTKYEKLIYSMDTVKIISKIEEYTNTILYYIFKSTNFKGHSIGYTSGTTVLHLSKRAIPEYKVVLPIENDLINTFHKVVTPFLEKINSNNEEIQTLVKLRDTLLPKLMSGEVEV